ncbi:dephospho-CoA kinase [Pararhizobium gei]|uniref:dephospho-CoA kinase n=1 Tax=Pararhizobium gei TaxID=1395951 RepID=UPI0023DAD250|nr:dephospho-CoA kinase [Rhizobium gei]
MIVLGLTGSIGMGKSTVAAMFADHGVPVNDADAIVHTLYQGTAAALIEAHFPGSTANGVVDRKALSKTLAEHPSAFKILEGIVHPLVREAEQRFLADHRALNTPLVLLDIPLLFEAGGADRVDAVVVVTCDEAIQKERVLKRPGMTEEKLALILSRQMPDADKRAKADYIIDTSGDLDSSRRQVADVIRQVASQKGS